MKKKELTQPEPVLAKKRKRNQPLGYLFLFPVMLSLSVFTFYPFFRSVYLTFFMADRLGNAKKFVGFNNYIRLWQNGEMMETIGDTVVYASLICVGTFCLALILAYLCVDPVKGSRGYQTMFSLPLALATAPIAAVGAYIFGYHGMLNGVLGTQINWLGHDVFKIICVVFLVCWCNCGTSFIYLLVGFRNVPDDLIESANLDGASAWTKFFKIYLPIASPQVFYVVFLNILTAFKSFTMIKVLFGTDENGLRVLSGTIYQKAILELRFETACVYSLILCVLIFLVTRVQFILEKKVVHYQ